MNAIYHVKQTTTGHYWLAWAPGCDEALWKILQSEVAAGNLCGSKYTHKDDLPYREFTVSRTYESDGTIAQVICGIERNW